MENLYFRIGILALALIGIALFSVPVRAQEVQRALICDTASQIEEIYTSVVEVKNDMQETVDAVNARDGERSCIVAVVEAVVEEEVKALELDGTPYAILRIRVVAVRVRTPQGVRAQPVDDMVQYVIARKGPKVVRQDA